MIKVAIVSGSTRIGRNSHRVSVALERFIEANYEAKVRILDVQAVQFPPLNSGFADIDQPSDLMHHFGEGLKLADAIIILSPEYNGSYTGAMKNAIDHFYGEYKKKVMGVCAVSTGALGGIRAALNMQQMALGLGAYPIPRMLTVANVLDNVNQEGEVLTDSFQKQMKGFCDEFIWLTEAVMAKKAQ